VTRAYLLVLSIRQYEPSSYPITALTPTIATTTSVKTATQIAHSNMARLPSLRL